jgi:V/A-type H+-transporting ATPase subunit I
MFLPARMKKFRAVVLDEYRDTLVKELHEVGVVELRGVERSSLSEDAEFLSMTRGSTEGKEVMSLLLKLNILLDSFKHVGTRDQGESPGKILVEEADRRDAMERARRLLDEVEAPVAGLKESLDRVQEELEELSAYSRELEKIIDLDFDLQFLGDSSSLTTLCGEMPAENAAGLKEELEDSLVLTPDGEEVVPVILSGLKEDRDRILDAAKKWGFEEYALPKTSGTPRDALAGYAERMEELQKDRRRLEKELLDMRSRHEQEALAARECLQIEKERIDVLTMFANSRRTYFLQGYVPKKKAGRVRDLLVERTRGHAVLSFGDPDDEDEGEIPVLLENPRQVRPFEMLTEMFAPPKYNEFDPTLILTPAFIIFFGIMLTDAVYGAVVTLLGYGIMKYFEKTSPSGRDLGIVLSLAGLSAVFWGILFGSYFGNLFSPEGGLLNGFLSIPALWLDPFSKDLYHGQSPVVVILIMALLIGFLHLNIGNSIGLKETLKKKGSIKEVFTNLWLVVFQVGLILYVVGPKPLGGIIALTGVGLLFYSEGILGFFGVTGWLGDSLSYARLLAMGLATGGIAIAINILVDMTGGIKFIGPIIATVIFIGGHVFNIALNTLGAFIHSLRLHYVEFFGRFYEGGGEKFKPFKVERVYTEINRGE